VPALHAKAPVVSERAHSVHQHAQVAQLKARQPQLAAGDKIVDPKYYPPGMFERAVPKPVTEARPR